MGLFDGKTGIIMGVANERSIATGIAEFLSKEGAELAFSFLPDEHGRSEMRVQKAIGHLKPKVLRGCNVNNDQEIQDFFTETAKVFPKIDFLVHSIAFAALDEIRKPTVEVSRQGFLTAMEASVYSFIATSRAAAPLMSQGGSILTISYLGGEKVVIGYNLMGLAKAALERSVQYLAYDLGGHGIRVNALSAGPIKTLAASAVGDLNTTLQMNAAIAPLKRNVSSLDIAKSAAYLLSDLSSGTTGEILHVDCGFSIMGAPTTDLLTSFKEKNHS